jgi:hypothetical protein
MAQNTIINLTASAWTRVTDADATTVLFQNRSTEDVYVAATAGATPPTSSDGAVLYEPNKGITKTLIADLAVGVSAANNLYAWCDGEYGKLYVSHD